VPGSRRILALGVGLILRYGSAKANSSPSGCRSFVSRPSWDAWIEKERTTKRHFVREGAFSIYQSAMHRPAAHYVARVLATNEPKPKEEATNVA